MWNRFAKNSQKYGAKRVEINGEGFPSKLEAAVYQYLLLMEKAKEISDIKRQVRVDLTDAKIGWKVDFSYYDIHTEEVTFCEAKGMEDDRYKIMKRLWPHYGLGTLHVWKGTYRNPKCAETIKLLPSRALWLSKAGLPPEYRKACEQPGKGK